MGTPVQETADKAERLRQLDEAVKKMRGAEQENLVVNINEAWKEHRIGAKPFCLTLDGIDYEVSSSIPADFGLFYSQHCLSKVKLPNGDEEILLFSIPEDRYYTFLDLMVGEKLTEAIAKSKMTFQFVNDTLITPIMRRWGLIFDDSVVPKESLQAEAAEKKSLT